MNQSPPQSLARCPFCNGEYEHSERHTWSKDRFTVTEHLQGGGLRITIRGQTGAYAIQAYLDQEGREVFETGQTYNGKWYPFGRYTPPTGQETETLPEIATQATGKEDKPCG